MTIYGNGYDTSERFLKFITKTEPHPYYRTEQLGIKDEVINRCVFGKDEVKLVAKFCKDNNYILAVWARNRDEILQANDFGVNFILIEKDLLPQVQEFKQNPNFQSQFLLIVNSDENFTEFENSGIDAMVIRSYLYDYDRDLN